MESIEAQQEGLEIWPVAVVGAGAAGLLAAIFAGRAGARVLLLETKERPGAKIRVSGGGRCNLLPSQVSVEDFHTAGSVPAMRNVLSSWPLPAMRRFFEEELAIALKTEPTGKVFPESERPQEVVEALLGECARRGVTLRGGFEVAAVEVGARGGAGRFTLRSAAGETVRCERLILATGGLSLPKTGSDGKGIEIARALGHSIIPVYPALVPLLTPDARFRALAGVSARARLRVSRDGKQLEEREGDFLFTHRGFSGPVALDLSRHFASPGGEAAILSAHWGGAEASSWDALLRQGGAKLAATLLRERLPRRLADLLLEAAGPPEARKSSELTREERKRLVAALESCPLPISGNEGYRTAEVTGGGVPLSELDLRTLESRLVPGLHLAGELLDVTGRIGGYNFLWAFVSGRKAGEGAGDAQGQPPQGR